MRRVPLAEIRGAFQARAELSADATAEYAARLQAGDTFPPVVVYSDLAGRLWLADGWHRVAAARELAWTEITADVRRGSQHDAFRHALGANAAHGLQRTRADKRRAVAAALADPEIGALSDREIARITATSHPFVGLMRALPAGGNDSTPVPEPIGGPQLWVAERLPHPLVCAFIGASREHPGFAFASIVCDGADGAEAIETRRPIRHDHVRAFLAQHGVVNATWRRVEAGPFGSAAELIDTYIRVEDAP